MQRRGVRYRGANHHVNSEDARSEGRGNLSIRWRIPREVTMGIRLVMVGDMLVCGFALMVVVVVHARMGLITVGMEGIWVGKERKGLLSPCPMINKHMRRGEEKRENDAKG